MSEKKLGRPKGKDKPAGAEWLFHEWLTAEDKATLERYRLICRVQRYQAKAHGATPTALPKVTNKELLKQLIRDAQHLYRGVAKNSDLERYLREKGCQNADELLPEGADK